MNGTLKVKHEIYGEKTEEKTQVFVWKLKLDYDGKPQLLVSDDDGNSFVKILKLDRGGKWTTYSGIYRSLVKKYPTIFARKKHEVYRAYNESYRMLCMWDEKTEGE